MSDDTTQLVYIPDHEHRAEHRLLAIWDRPRIRAFVRALGFGVQYMEDTLFNLLIATTIDNATGHSLDQWGDIVGEDRGPLSDSEYRQFIKARMLVNISDGTVESLLNILETAAAPVVRVEHESSFPAGFLLQVTRTSFLTDEAARRVARMMEDARPGGRHMTLIEALVNSFGFAGDPEAEGFDEGPYSRLLEAT